MPERSWLSYLREIVAWNLFFLACWISRDFEDEIDSAERESGG